MSIGNNKIINVPIINSLRGIAALSVCLFHFVCSNLIDNKEILYIFDFGRKGVQIFFIISGVVISLSLIKNNFQYKDFFNFLKIRFWRIEPPYLATVLLGIIYLNLRNFLPTGNNQNLAPNFKEILLHIGYLIPFFENSRWITKVFWTLSIEFQYYLCFALIFPLLNKKTINISIILLTFLSPFFLKSYYHFPYWASYFSIGITYSFYLSKHINKLKFIVLTLVFSISVFLNQGVIDLIIALVTLFIIHNFKNFKSDVTEFLGKISYSLYLTHTLIGLTIINYFNRYDISNFNKFILISLTLIFSIFIGYVFWKYIENPSQKISKSIRHKS